MDGVSPSIREVAVGVAPGLADEMGLPPRYAKLAVAELAAQQIAMLGGDVYSPGSPPRPPYRNWYADRAAEEDWRSYVERSRHAAINAIEAIASDGEVLIVLVCATEDDERNLRKRVRRA